MQVVELLTEANCDLLRCNKQGNTILHLAAKYGHHKLTEFLLGKKIPIDLRGERGITPLGLTNDEEIKDVLLKAGADPFCVDDEGQTPFSRAIHKGNWFVNIEIPEEKCSDVLACFQEAIKVKQTARVLSYLGLRAKQLVNRADNHDNRLIHYGVLSSDVDFVHQLGSEFHADVNCMGANGKTPLVLAAEQDNPNLRMVQVLLKLGASPVCLWKGNNAFTRVFEKNKRRLDLWSKETSDFITIFIQIFKNSDNHEILHLIALFYYKSVGVRQDFHQAFLFCSIAANKGNQLAMVWLAQFFLLGRGTQQNEGQALQFLRQSVSRDKLGLNPDFKQLSDIIKDPSLERLGRLTRVPKDKWIRSVHWLFHCSMHLKQSRWALLANAKQT